MKRYLLAASIAFVLCITSSYTDWACYQECVDRGSTHRYCMTLCHYH